MDMLNEYAEQNEIDLETLQDSDVETEYEKEKNRILNDTGVALTKQYGKQVKQWLDSQKKDETGMEFRLQDTMLSDCLDVIRWYQYLFEAKLTRALM